MFERIESHEDLEALAEILLAEKVVAFDTEADSFYHYYDKTCLVQVATRRRVYLIDPIALGGPAELAPLGPIMASREVRKVFHAAEYDLYVLTRDCGFRFRNLFDTMASGQLLGYPALGLSALIERHFGVTLPKDEQRSDWSQRPLRQSQLTYAAADVRYLIRLSEKLEKELRAARRLEWAREEFAALASRKWPDREFDPIGYLRIKGARRLDPSALAILRELYRLRDARAREMDRPPFKVLGNRTLLEIAQTKPRSQKALAALKGVTDLIIRRYGRELIAAVAAGQETPHGPIPRTEGNGRRRLDRRTERRLSALKRWRSARARELSLDPGVLCPNSALEAIAFRNPNGVEEVTSVSGLKPWFAREFADEVARVLEEGESG